MSLHWEKAVAAKLFPTTLCEECKERVIAIVAPIETAFGPQISVHCSKCLIMLNLRQNVQIIPMSPDMIFKSVGCEPLPHYTRYNLKYSFGIGSSLLSTRWRQF